MNKKFGYALAGILVLTGALLFYFGLKRPVTLYLYDIPQSTTTRGITVRNVLKSIGFSPNRQDYVQPGLNHLVGWNTVIDYKPSSVVHVESADGNISEQTILADRIPANMLAAFDIRLFPSDSILWNAKRVEPLIKLPPADNYNLQYIEGIKLDLVIDGIPKTIYTSADTIAEALWEKGISLNSADRVDPAPGISPEPGQVITIDRARPITIRIGDQEILSYSAALSIGEALAKSGNPLQGMDYSIPAEDQPLPDDGVVEVFRVREEIILAQETVPYEVEYVEDPETELDQQSVVQDGQLGLKVIQTRIRYENGAEVSNVEEAQWTASEPRNEKIGYGTKVVIRTLDTGSGTIEYWRAVNVYATAYSPCRSAADRCYYGTSYGIPVARGVIGVVRSWYNLMAGWPVYVPGYGQGIIADTGGGVAGKYWIDLGFTDDDFEAWHQDVTLYFLTPVPDNIPWILP